MKKVKKSLTKKEVNWIAINAKSNAIKPDQITIAFGSRKSTGTWSCQIRIGIDVLNEIGWNPDSDKLIVYHDKDDIYSWMICRSEYGLTLNKETSSATSRRINLSWNTPGINFNKSRHVKYTLQKDKILFRVPLDE